MTYVDDVKFDELVAQISGAAEIMMRAHNEGVLVYDKWQAVSAGKTDAQIATQLSTPSRTVTEAEVALLRAAAGGFFEVKQYAAGEGTPYVGNREFAWNKFR